MVRFFDLIQNSCEHKRSMQNCKMILFINLDLFGTNFSRAASVGLYTHHPNCVEAQAVSCRTESSGDSPALVRSWTLARSSFGRGFVETASPFCSSKLTWSNQGLVTILKHFILIHHGRMSYFAVSVSNDQKIWSQKQRKPTLKIILLRSYNTNISNRMISTS